jgi:HSP20 family protein
VVRDGISVCYTLVDVGDGLQSAGVVWAKFAAPYSNVEMKGETSMSMIRKDPFEALMPLREAVNRLFEDSFVWPGRLEVFTGRTFPVDVYETKDKEGYIVEASLPGAKPEDISISAMGDTLTIHYAAKGEEKVEKPNYVRRERFEGEMTRTITLPTHILPEKVQATYKQGVLKLQVPKSEEVKPKQIPIIVKELAGAH